MNAAEHLAECAWKTPDCYGGFDPVGDFVVLTRHRDSELLDNCNWDVACESLKAEAHDAGFAAELSTDRPNVYHWRAGHWAVGWVEYLMVRADAPEDVQESAGEIVCSLADYPILDESRFGELEWNAVCAYWESCDVSDRVHELQRARLCIFAARRDELPDDPNGALYERLREGL